MPPKRGTKTGRKSAPAVSKDEAQIGHKCIGSIGDETAPKRTRRSQRLTAASAASAQDEDEQEEEEDGEESEPVVGVGVAKLGQGSVKAKTGARGQKTGGQGGKMGGQGGKAAAAAAEVDDSSDTLPAAPEPDAL